ncbi:substrate-binding periplasmic protein [Roseibium hamelinense]|uniref:substrate-binding periplasmic protein n=1 Tax=Roseibium hamelinense TaxID=150831 RepID=UPI0012BB7412|nr:transporter substrate-binding domain-containing protein [Roseibium hamelinense]
MYHTIIFAVLIFFRIVPSDVRAETIAFGVGEWSPFVGEKLHDKGLYSKLVAEFFEKNGFQVALEFYPWRRSLELVRSGTLPATFPWSFTEDRQPDFYYPKRPIGFLNDVIYYRRDRFPNGLTINSINDIRSKGLSAVGISDYWYQNPLKEAGIEYHEVSYDEQAWKMLALGRVDIFIENDVVGDRRKASVLQNMSTVIDRSEPFRRVPVFILFSKKHPLGKKMMDVWDARPSVN